MSYIRAAQDIDHGLPVNCEPILGGSPMHGTIVILFVIYDLYKLSVSDVEYCHSQLVVSSNGLLLTYFSVTYLCESAFLRNIIKSKYRSCLTDDDLDLCLRLTGIIY